ALHDRSTAYGEAIVPTDIEPAPARASAEEMRRTRIEERRALRERIAQERQRPAIRERRAAVIERAHVRVIRGCHRQTLRDRLTELAEFTGGGTHDVVVAAFESERRPARAGHARGASAAAAVRREHGDVVGQAQHL